MTAQTQTSKPVDRRPKDPLMLAADAALRRAAEKAYERALAAAAKTAAVGKPPAR